MHSSRRSFLKQFSVSGTGILLFGAAPVLSSATPLVNTIKKVEAPLMTSQSNFQISLAQWSLHRSFFGETITKGWQHFGKMLREDPDAMYAGPLDPNEFPAIARNQFGVKTIELVNTFYYSKAQDNAYWDGYKNNCKKLGVNVALIMCDALGDIGDQDKNKRQKAVENHYPWIDIAKNLGSHSIRVNAAGQGTSREVAKNAIDGLKQLTAYGQSQKINVIVENHGGFSSDGQWLSSVIKAVDNPYCGTLPDFGNFCLERSASGCTIEYDRYKGVEELVPFAKGLSAKAYDFNSSGDETSIDFQRMLKIAANAGYKGFVGIEYEGSRLSEQEGILATKKLLEKSIAALQ